MPDLTDYYLNSRSNIVQYETLEIYHIDFTKTYFVVRNNTKGLTATLETSSSQFFDYCPMRITQNTVGNDLDFVLTIEFGDVGELLPFELDEVFDANGLFTKPTLKYRTFRSDDLSSPMFGPIELEVTEFSFDRYGAKFEATATKTNSQKTGELYTIDRFPMLRAFL